MIMICQDKSVGEPLAARFCIMKDTEPFGGSSAVFLPTLTLSCQARVVGELTDACSLKLRGDDVMRRGVQYRTLSARVGRLLMKVGAGHAIAAAA